MRKLISEILDSELTADWFFVVAITVFFCVAVFGIEHLHIIAPVSCVLSALFILVIDWMIKHR